MSFLFVNKTLRLNIFKIRAAINLEISVFVICAEAIIYLLLFNLHDFTFKNRFLRNYLYPSVLTKIFLFKLWQQEDLKRAKKLYFMYYFPVVIIFFSTGLCKPPFSTYDFGKTSLLSFCVLVFEFNIFSKTYYCIIREYNQSCAL